MVSLPQIAPVLATPGSLPPEAVVMSVESPVRPGVAGATPGLAPAVP